jgi:hypothetical protein
MRDYIRVATVIVHDASDPNATRYGAYFATMLQAKTYRDEIEAASPGFYAYDVYAWRWIGINKNALVQILNSAYYDFFNYQHFVEGYDGFADEQDAETFGRGLVITLASPRAAGFNSVEEKKRGGILTFAT